MCACVRACVRVCVCFEPVPNILNTSALYYILKSGIGMPPVSTSIFIRIFFFLSIQGLLGFPTNFGIMCFSSVRATVGSWMGLHSVCRLFWAIWAF